MGHGLAVVGACAYIIICRFLLGVLPLCFVYCAGWCLWYVDFPLWDALCVWGLMLIFAFFFCGLLIGCLLVGYCLVSATV